MESTTSALENAEILKGDKRGRVWTSPERREALLDEFERSGISGAQFARLSGLKYSSFQNWLQRRRKLRGAGSMARAEGNGPVRLLEAVVDGGSGGCGAGLLIELPGGGRVRVESPLQLRLAAELLGMMAETARSRRC